MPRVSVIIPVYNVERYVAECLDSVVSQTFEDIEIICVDDGSTDGSAGILDRYAQTDSRIVIVDLGHQGLAGARNSGYQRSSGEYVLFLDSDDYFEPTMIEEAYSKCVEDGAEVCIFKIRYVNVSTGKSVDAAWSLRTDLLPDKPPFCHSDTATNVLLAVTPAVWNKMFKRSLIDGHGLAFCRDLERAEDVPFTYLALLLAKRITWVDKALANYRMGQPGSLQATIHERPMEICNALALTKCGAIEAGIFDEVERDFVNAALYQCLFTLDSFATSDAFLELYEALRSRWLSELGISGKNADYFDDQRRYEQSLRIAETPAEVYLFEATRQSRGEAEEVGARLRDVSARLARAEVALREGSMESLLFSEARRLGKQLRAARGDLRAVRRQANKARTRVLKIQQSPAYRIGRLATALPRGLRSFVPPKGKAV